MHCRGLAVAGNRRDRAQRHDQVIDRVAGGRERRNAVAEASPASAATVTPKKIKAIMVASSELFANPAAEELVRADR